MRIKVTGYIDSDDLPASHVDHDHETGLSDDAFLAFATGGEALPPLDDIEFEKVD